jgi:hypothetical protein
MGETMGVEIAARQPVFTFRFDLPDLRCSSWVTRTRPVESG